MTLIFNTRIFGTLALILMLTFAYTAFAEDTAGAVTSGPEISNDVTNTQGTNTGVVPPKPPLLKLPIKTTPGGTPPISGVCPAIYAPVCASDGKTYGNSCVAKNAGVTVVKNGPCDVNGLRPNPIGTQPILNAFGTKGLPPLPPKPGEMRGKFEVSTTGPMKEQVKQRMEDRAKESLKRFVKLTLATIERLQKLIVRVESRADKLSQLGVDTSGARADLGIAKTELDAAKLDLDTLRNSTASILGAQNMAAVVESLAPLRTTIESAQRHIHNAEKAIRDAVKKLSDAAKAAGIKEGAPATTTAPII